MEEVSKLKTDLDEKEQIIGDFKQKFDSIKEIVNIY
jgi:hypothetical protein